MLDHGHLVLRTERASVTGPDGKRVYNFTSGWVETQGKQETQFGRLEIRAQLPDPEARGIWPAHWYKLHRQLVFHRQVFHILMLRVYGAG